VIPSAIGPPGLVFQNPLSRRRLAKLERGAVSHRLPAAVGCERGPLFGAIRRIRVPKNFTFLSLVLVIRVFSSERVRCRERRKDPMLFRRLFARDLGPQTPTSQSSA